MTTTEAFLYALKDEGIKAKYGASSIRTWRSRAIRNKLSLDFMVEFLRKNGYAIKQSMQWNIIIDASHTLSRKNESGHGSADGQNNKDHMDQLGKKLCTVRKQLSPELFNRWYEWSKAEYAADFPHKKAPLSMVVFSQMTYGRYISKQNVSFALKILKQGKSILHDYHEYIKREVENL